MIGETRWRHCREARNVRSASVCTWDQIEETSRVRDSNWSKQTGAMCLVYRGRQI